MKIYRSLPLLIALCTAAGAAVAEECTWIEKAQAEPDLVTLQGQMEQLTNWPSEQCAALESGALEDYKACYCKTVADQLTRFKQALDETLATHPEWRGKKICYKSDATTSVNLWLDSYESIANRCPSP